MEVSYRRFGKTYQSYLQGSSSFFLDCLTYEVVRSVGKKLPFYAA